MKANYVSYAIELPEDLAAELEIYAKEAGKKHGDVIEDVIADFLTERIKKGLADSFKRLKDDPEQMFLAEAGLGDFVKMMEDYENS